PMLCRDRTMLAAGLLAVLLAAPPLPAQDNRRYDSPDLILETGTRTGPCDALIFCKDSDGECLLAAGDDQVGRSWDFVGGQLLGKSPRKQARPHVLRWKVYREQRGAIFAMALSPDREHRHVCIAGNGMMPLAVVVLDRFTGEVFRSYFPKDRHPRANS